MQFDPAATTGAPADYSSIGKPLQQLLEGCITRSPSRFIGRDELLYASASTKLELAKMPGVLIHPLGATPEEGTLFLPHNLVTMGQRPTTLSSLAVDPIKTTPSGLKLKNYQRQSVTFLRNVTVQDGGAILAADAGTGKSCVALQALWLDGYLHRNGLVIGPLGAANVWCGPKSDATKHYKLNVTPLEGTMPNAQLLQQGGWFFIHYEVIREWQSFLTAFLRPAAIVIDESHMAMNAKGRRWEALTAVTGMSTTEKRFALTGTPIPKTRMDLYGQLAAVQPGQWGRQFNYGVRFAGGRILSHEDGKGHWVFDAQTNTDELRARLAGVYLRFSKTDVASDLPKLKRHRIDVELPPDLLKEYRQARSAIMDYRRSKGLAKPIEKIVMGGVEIKLDDETPKALQLVTVTTLKSILDRAKLARALETITTVFPRHKRMVVFTWQRASAKSLHEDLARTYQGTTVQVFGPIDGSSKCPWPKRIETAAAFAAVPLGILVATRGSVGIAINDLSAADACLQITPDWNPDGNLQAESRLHRSGAWADEIHSYYMLAPGTLDDRVLELLDTKSREASSLAASDKAGMHLAVDLDPTIGDDNWSIDQLCSLLEEVEEM